MARRDSRTGHPAILILVLAVVAIIAAGLFLRLSRRSASPEAAGVGPLGNNPAAGLPPGQTKGIP